ncbi:MAG: glycosyltransferase [Geobacter sp.]|nr:glycosyltransferase [Geobacter sp.]
MVKKISVIIPVKPGGAVKAIGPLMGADYPADAFEVLVAEGRSPSSQRNEAARMASGELLYFLDDDSMAPPDALLRISRHFDATGVVAVGGPSLTPATDSSLQRAFGLAFASIFGGGGVRTRYWKTGRARSTGDHELILCNLSFRREQFLDHGGFDERLYPNEENELMDRLVKSGGTLIHDPDLAVSRSQRPTFRAFVRQLFTYGRGRGEQSRISGSIKPMALVPALFLLYLTSVPVVGKPIYSIPLLCYLILNVIFSVLEAGRGGSPNLSLRLLAIFPTFHLCYGAGVMVGLAFPRYRTQRECGEVMVRRVKEFGGWGPGAGER